MRTLLMSAAACCFAMSAQAAPSDLIRDVGLAGAIESLESQPELTPDDRLALSGITFLRAIEKAYQTRWQVGYVTDDLPLPLFSNELPVNPEPEMIEGDTLNALFEVFLADMAKTDALLAEIPEGSNAAFELSLPDIWFDINMNGTRDAEEDFGKTALQNVLSRWQIREFERQFEDNPELPNPLQATIRFDEADAHWLRAYTNVISGVSELILAFDPQPEIQKALDLRRAIYDQRLAMAAQFPGLQKIVEFSLSIEIPTEEEIAEYQKLYEQLSVDDRNALGEILVGERNWMSESAHFVDMAAVVIETLRHQPDQARVAKAQQHLLDMVDHNRNFWRLVIAETDNDREWIPNGSQQAALGIEMPQNIDEAWLAVLTDMEKMLKGELLVPFWRYAPGHGIDINAWVQNPAPLNVIGWAQGTATLPYARQGEVMTGDNWIRFERMVQRQSGLFVFMLN
ncbi:hypothetical protein [Halocynthiibacter styelae]|uniref:Uncharacterized protein n=1 Tax=Halocynthiibacter styelae TaxID=2761955 RepID=A0A8J7IBZ9_9RHOB|nr:hypothetical protein [Paenihalocynthiibacter styelae]MBI1492748.1 hypothetical protein [Paenihalocynthiibacter styelae]